MYRRRPRTVLCDDLFHSARSSLVSLDCLGTDYGSRFALESSHRDMLPNVFLKVNFWGKETAVWLSACSISSRRH